MKVPAREGAWGKAAVAVARGAAVQQALAEIAFARVVVNGSRTRQEALALSANVRSVEPR